MSSTAPWYDPARLDRDEDAIREAEANALLREVYPSLFTDEGAA